MFDKALAVVSDNKVSVFELRDKLLEVVSDDETPAVASHEEISSFTGCLSYDRILKYADSKELFLSEVSFLCITMFLQTDFGIFK